MFMLMLMGREGEGDEVEEWSEKENEGRSSKNIASKWLFLKKAHSFTISTHCQGNFPLSIENNS